jgi:CheY-like chemotaxis protein
MKSKKILFIEDEPDQIMVVKIRLEADGFEFISATNGEDGLKEAQSEKPDLILLDIIMPKMDGYEVCKRLKADPKTKAIPVIVITAVATKDLEQKCVGVGADDLIRKPYESADLVAKIKSFFK